MALSLTNRLLAFAVPLFLFISAVLSASSALRNGVKSCKVRQFFAVAYPYLLWSLFYWVFRFELGEGQSLTYAEHWLFLRQIPTFWANIDGRVHDLLWGKAFFHLYFLIVLLELLIVTPILVHIAKIKSIASSLIVGIFLQFAFLLLQHFFFKFFYPASTIFWYVDILMPGMALGRAFFKNQGIVLDARTTFLATLGVILGGLLYLIEEYHEARNQPVHNYRSNGGLAVYSTCASLLLYQLCAVWNLRSFSKYPALQNINEVTLGIFIWLGRNSLAIYLIHPGILTLLSTKVLISHLQRLGLSGWPAFLITLGGSMIFAYAIDRLKLSRILLGRPGN